MATFLPRLCALPRCSFWPALPRSLCHCLYLSVALSAPISFSLFICLCMCLPLSPLLPPCDSSFQFIGLPPYYVLSPPGQHTPGPLVPALKSMGRQLSSLRQTCSFAEFLSPPFPPAQVGRWGLPHSAGPRLNLSLGFEKEKIGFSNRGTWPRKRNFPSCLWIGSVVGSHSPGKLLSLVCHLYASVSLEDHIQGGVEERMTSKRLIWIFLNPLRKFLLNSHS